MIIFLEIIILLCVPALSGAMDVSSVYNFVINCHLTLYICHPRLLLYQQAGQAN